MKQSIWISLSVLWLGMLACQPVIAIGWREGVFIIMMIALLIVPPVYRLFRRLDKAREKTRK